MNWVDVGPATMAALVPGGMVLRVYDAESDAIAFVPGNSEEIATWVHIEHKLYAERG